VPAVERLAENVNAVAGRLEIAMPLLSWE